MVCVKAFLEGVMVKHWCVLLTERRLICYPFVMYSSICYLLFAIIGCTLLFVVQVSL